MQALEPKDNVQKVCKALHILHLQDIWDQCLADHAFCKIDGCLKGPELVTLNLQAFDAVVVSKPAYF